MTQFHAGQDVEVRQMVLGKDRIGFGAIKREWRKAKIVCGIVVGPVFKEPQDQYEVQFPDGTRAVFDVEHIRAVEPTFKELQDFDREHPAKFVPDSSRIG